MDDLVCVAAGFGLEPGTWKLYCCPSKSSPPWHALVLVAPSREEAHSRRRFYKSRYHLAWNGRRLRVTRELKILRRSDPSILRWLEQTCPLISHLRTAALRADANSYKDASARN
jgi:hypothetical protein